MSNRWKKPGLHTVQRPCKAVRAGCAPGVKPVAAGQAAASMAQVSTLERRLGREAALASMERRAVEARRWLRAVLPQVARPLTTGQTV